MKPTDDLVREFDEAAGQHVGRPGDIPSVALIQHRLRLIREEFEEVDQELLALLSCHRARVEPVYMLTLLAALLKEMCDLRYVLDGTAVAFGLPYEEAYRDVHASNMSKRFPDGTFHANEYGKVIKGPNYEPPDSTRWVPPVLEHEPTGNEGRQGT